MREREERGEVCECSGKEVREEERGEKERKSEGRGRVCDIDSGEGVTERAKRGVRERESRRITE